MREAPSAIRRPLSPGLGVSRSLWYCLSASGPLTFALDASRLARRDFPSPPSPTLGWAGLTLPPPSLRAAENSFSKKTNGSQCLVRRFPPPSSRQTGSLVRAGGGLPGCRILCLRGASAGVCWSRAEYTAADRGLLEGEHFKRNSGQLQRWGWGSPSQV